MCRHLIAWPVGKSSQDMIDSASSDRLQGMCYDRLQSMGWDTGQYPGSEGLPSSCAKHGLLEHADEHGLLPGRPLRRRLQLLQQRLRVAGALLLQQTLLLSMILGVGS